MIDILLVTMIVLCAALALRARRLLVSAICLAGTSALLSIALYRLGAFQAAVIELSVGAGLVTVLFVFVIGAAGEESTREHPLLPGWLSWGLVLVSVLLLGWFVLPAKPLPIQVSEPEISQVIWQQRGLDTLVQIILIFAGVLGLLGLLAEAKAPLSGAAADEVAARRRKELDVLERQALHEQELRP